MTRVTRLILTAFALWCVAWSVSFQAATGTIMPSPFQVFLDSNGNPISGGKICTYIAGTTTLTATYTDSALSVANSNPIVTDTAGRFTAYLSPGASYKFIYQNSDGTANTCNGTVIKTVDNVSAVPAGTTGVDVTGTAGEALTAGQAVYLSDGSGSKVAGQWYKADAAQAYSSTAPQIGIVPASISNGGSGTVRLAGQLTGLSSLTIGADYYIGTAGALTSTAPTQARRLGRADSTSTLTMGLPPVPVTAWVDDFRLTLTTATPITTADVTAATTLYCSPLTGNRIDLPDSVGNPTRVTSAEFSIAVPATTSQMYDVFAYNSAGVATLELTAWTNDTTRATAIIRTTTGRYYKTGDLTRLYIGSVRTTTVSGQTEDSAAKRYVWNYYNRAPRSLFVKEATATWVGSGTVLRQVRGSTANQVEVVVGVAETSVTLAANLMANNATTANTSFATSIGFDSTTTSATGVAISSNYITAASAAIVVPVTAALTHFPTVGRHFYAWLEKQGDAAPANTTWFGDHTGTSGGQSALVGGTVQ